MWGAKILKGNKNGDRESGAGAVKKGDESLLWNKAPD
jgi:hypothetical protein